jgi:hypothetical protein
MSKFIISIYENNQIVYKELSLDDLEVIAKQAYKEDVWVYDHDDNVIESDQGGAVAVVCENANIRTTVSTKEEWSHADAKHIAAFHPKLVLQLIKIIKDNLK